MPPKHKQTNRLEQPTQAGTKRNNMPHANSEKKKEYMAMYVVKNKDKLRSKWLFRTYGITAEDWDEMYNAQGGRCGICDTHQSEQKRRMDVDHNHSTGKVRALLCTNCNTAVGLVKESVEIANKLAVYLTEHDDATNEETL